MVHMMLEPAFSLYNIEGEEPRMTGPRKENGPTKNEGHKSKHQATEHQQLRHGDIFLSGRKEGPTLPLGGTRWRVNLPTSKSSMPFSNVSCII